MPGTSNQDADLRAGLVSAVIAGAVIDRYLHKLSALADDIVELLRPCFESLAGERVTELGQLHTPSSSLIHH
ncbi:hypothetical protein ACIBI9_55860 [Nonomuraea sp. NPDC050451]|uniref:hypothetical protein n=1 Tax=Nonomuraea sp. NPDC050451 TaxID=3364364 RepID=UPI00379465DE